MASPEELKRFEQEVVAMEREAYGTTDLALLSPFTRSILAEIRRVVDAAITDLDGLRDSMPEAERNTIASALMTARGEIAGVLQDEEDGA